MTTAKKPVAPQHNSSKAAKPSLESRVENLSPRDKAELKKLEQRLPTALN